MRTEERRCCRNGYKSRTLKSPVFKLDTNKAQNKLKAAVKEEIKEEITTKVQEFIEEKIQDEELQEKGRNLLKKLLR